MQGTALLMLDAKDAQILLTAIRIASQNGDILKHPMYTPDEGGKRIEVLTGKLRRLIAP